ncbi:MAG: threonylcarbamoyl-AMP synthase [Thiotrichaceae bacterium]|nr:threonylcarbamoyl-AMP synthase [Thiotrichaceae bacterium]
MSQYFYIHPENPQPRNICQAINIINKGGVIVYPTDSGYAIGCHLDDKSAVDRIRLIRRLNDKHHFTLMCRDLSEISRYAIVDNINYRLLKSHTPGGYTFILEASREIPRRLRHPKRKTIGIRIPDNNIALALLEELDAPLISSSLILPNDELPMSDPYEIQLQLEKQVDLIIDGGHCGNESTTVVDLIQSPPEILRQGQGDTDWLRY